MYKQLESQELVIQNSQDVVDTHKRVISFHGSKSCGIMSEWQCLLNTLKKNLFVNSIPEFLSYPYTLVKSEEPDFKVVLSSGEVILIEITRATTMKNEALKHQLSHADEDIEMAEVSNDMFTLEKPHKGEMRKNLVNKGDGLQGTGMYGWYAERQWVSIILSAIESKRKKHYASNVDILLIDDKHLPYASPKYVNKRFEFIKMEIDCNTALTDLQCFPFILTDTPGALGIIRQDNQWLVNPLFLPDGWMAD